MHSDKWQEFFRAVGMCDLETVRGMLAEDGGLVHARDFTGATGLHMAALASDKNMVALLCEAGADLDARDRTFQATPTGWAAQYMRVHGGFLATEIDDVIHAVRTNDVAWARRFLDRHPKIVDARDAEGKTVVEHVRECGSVEMNRLLDSYCR